MGGQVKITRVEEHNLHWRTVAIDLEVNRRTVRLSITQTSERPPEIQITMPLGMELPEWDAFREAVSELARQWEHKYGNVLAPAAEMEPHAPFSLFRR